MQQQQRGRVSGAGRSVKEREPIYRYRAIKSWVFHWDVPFLRSESLNLSKARRPPALAEIRGQAGPRARPTSKALSRRRSSRRLRGQMAAGRRTGVPLPRRLVPAAPRRIGSMFRVPYHSSMGLLDILDGTCCCLRSQPWTHAGTGHWPDPTRASSRSGRRDCHDFCRPETIVIRSDQALFDIGWSPIAELGRHVGELD